MTLSSQEECAHSRMFVEIAEAQSLVNPQNAFVKNTVETSEDMTSPQKRNMLLRGLGVN